MGKHRKKLNFGAMGLGLTVLLGFAIAALSPVPPGYLAHAQTTENRPPTFDSFRFSLEVSEETPVGGAFGEPLAATDPDGDSLYFVLTNGHTDLFSIDSGTGQLRTKALLDYETKPEDNYWLHVSVRDGKGTGGERDLVADDQGLVVIEVTDGDEPGTVTPNWLRPQIDVALIATLTDPNGSISAKSWQWSKSGSRSGTFTNINGATSASYTPQTGDLNQYLRVTVNYADEQRTGRRASFGFAHPVRRLVAARSGSPRFSEGTSTTRSIVENTASGVNIGSPVRATGASQLRYTLGGTDESSFTIHPWSGQLSAKDSLDYETKNSYSLTVRATDPSTRTASITVTINVINQPVEIDGPSRVEYSESDFAYSAVVVENYNVHPNGAALTLTGADARHFTITSSPGRGSHGRIVINQAPDYEAPGDSGRNNVYNITVNAAAEVDGTRHTARHNLQVAVTDYNEGPVISGPESVEYVEHTTGPVGRYTARDPENDPIRWAVQDTDDWTYFKISRSGVLTFKEPPDFEQPGVSDNVYEVVILAQSGMNAATDGERVAVTVTDSKVDPPHFKAGYSTPLEVSENAGPDTPIGEPVAATDLNGKTLTYSLRGAHFPYFSLDSATGQLKTKSPFNYEFRNNYSVTVRASNGSLATDAAVTINVINEEEAGTVTYYPTVPRARIPLTARLTDPDGGVTDESWTWELSSDGSSWSTISGAESATYTPADSDVGNFLRAVASYTDGQGAGKSAEGPATVAVTTGPNRSPSMQSAGTDISIEVAENTAAATEIGAPVTTTDPDGDTLTYSLAGRDASAFSIVAASGQLKTRAALDYERKSSYTLVVRARDPSNSYVNMTVNITVTDVDEAGTVALSTSQPRVGSSVTATLNDPDTPVTETTWQWEKADDATGTNQVLISGATGRSYTPAAPDQGKYLRATATYTDSFGSGKAAQSDRAVIVAARAPRNNGQGGGGNNGGNSNPPQQGTSGGTGTTPPVTTLRTFSVSHRTANYRVNEGSSVRVTVLLSSAADRALRIPVTVSRGTAESGDYRISGLSGGAVQFSQGHRSRTFTVTALHDSDSDDEVLNLGFGALPQGISRGSIPWTAVAIKDDEVPALPQISLYYRSANYGVNEGSSVRVTALLSSAADRALRIPVTVSRGTAESGDYRVSGLTNGALQFSQGHSSRTFTVTALHDNDSDDETLSLGFGALPGGIGLGSIPRAVVTINDDEIPALPQLSLYYRSTRYAVSEGKSISITVSLSAESGRYLQIPITAAPQSAEVGDYQLSGLTNGNLTIGPGDRSGSFTFTARQDDDADDEQVRLGFGPLPADVALGSRGFGTVTIEDDDPAPVVRKLENSPPVFNDGGSAIRKVTEQADRETPVGLPVAATDPDGDLLTYASSGVDASYFSLDSRTGQLRVWGALDMEVKSTYLLTMSVSDGRGGTDFIEVSVNLTDIQEAPVVSPSTQAVGLASPESPFSLETPDGSAAIRLPSDFNESPYFVRVESAAVNCGGRWPAGEGRAYWSVQLFDTWGNSMAGVNLEQAVASLRFDALALGGVESAHAAYDNGDIQVYRYRQQTADWVAQEFSMEVDDLGVITLSVEGIKAQTCLVAVTRPIAPVPPLVNPEPEPDPQTWKAVAPVASRDRRSPESTPFPVAVVDVGSRGAPPGGNGAGGTAVLQAGMGGGSPWWPKLLLILGTPLLLVAVGWQIAQMVKERRGVQKTFTRPRKAVARDITRI